MTQRRIYQNNYPYFITTNTRKRIWFFDNQKIAKIISDSIINSCEMNHYILYAYCIMPNHVHILTKNMNEPTIKNISSLMHSIKSFSTKKVRDECNIEFKFWQSRFYHRVVYSQKNFENKIFYIKNNPAKAALENKYRKFPYLFINKKDPQQSRPLSLR